LPEPLVFGEWLRIGAIPVRLSFVLDAYSLPAATLVALVAWMALRFSATYLHRESGFPRFFLGMCLFLAGMLLIVLAANAVLAFVGWELAGISSWLLIAYTWERPLATGNALFVFLASRVGDAGFVLGIGLAVWSAGTVEWVWLAGDGSMSTVTARLLAAGFVLAALVKSAQLPFTPWIARALEGPTPSSAVFYGSLMVHAGVYLLCRLQGLLLQVPDLLALLAVVGLTTALYGGLCALVQSDVKSALIFSVVAQVGLMFFCCGLGLFWLAAGVFRPACGLACLPVPARTGVHAPGASPGAAVAALAGRAALVLHRGAATLLDRSPGQQPADSPDPGSGSRRAGARRTFHRPAGRRAARR
jgi:NADH:ubiquinone oxidoreductase subunit 5 (subunit L)/multisubunit Na+/H+ antiporter MnhA subunit